MEKAILIAAMDPVVLENVTSIVEEDIGVKAVRTNCDPKNIISLLAEKPEIGALVISDDCLRYFNKGGKGLLDELDESKFPYCIIEDGEYDGILELGNQVKNPY